MMIKDMKTQVEKAVNEVSMKYSKGIKFYLEDLMAVQVCNNEIHSEMLKNLVSNQLQNKKIAFQSWQNGRKIFTKA